MAKIKVKCGHCGHQFYMEDYEKKSCPKCGKVVVGPKAGQTSGGCFLTAACINYAGLSDDCFELQAMRKLRDEYIRKLPDGEAFISEYYAIAPEIVNNIQTNPNYGDVFKKIFHNIKKISHMIDNGHLDRAFAEYLDMFMHLRTEYITKSKSIR